MDNEKDRIVAVKAANALLKEAGLKQTWVVGVEDVAIEGDDYFRLKGYTWYIYMSPTVLMAIAADALKDIHEEYGVSVDYMMRFIIERIAGDDGGEQDESMEKI